MDTATSTHISSEVKLHIHIPRQSLRVGKRVLFIGSYDVSRVSGDCDVSGSIIIIIIIISVYCHDRRLFSGNPE
jgi:hypothetical protein